MTVLVRISNFLVTLAMAIAVATLLGITILPPLLHYRTYTVLSGSMSPAIRTGSIIVAVPVAPSTLKVGDVITYKRSDFPRSESVTHRIVAVSGTPNNPTFTTKGDANAAADDWQVAAAGTAGKVVLSVEEQAARAGTISYELLCAVGERVPRIYK